MKKIEQTHTLVWINDMYICTEHIAAVYNKVLLPKLEPATVIQMISGKEFVLDMSMDEVISTLAYKKDKKFKREKS